ncbi:MAG: DUF454 family protein [Planctomycetaceae bacterium]|nr:DUF454 family protein [Planctomycetaceae bacterium]
MAWNGFSFDAGVDVVDYLAVGTPDLAMPGVIPQIIPVSIAPPTAVQESGKAEPDRVEFGTGLRVECRGASGVVELHDLRMFRAGREAFCRALVEAAVTTGRALRATVCLTSATCRLEFEPGRFDRAELASRVVSAVRTATLAACAGTAELPGLRQGWTTLTALAMATGPSVWEASCDGPGRVVLRHRVILEMPWLAARLARALRDLPGVRACRARSRSARVVVACDERRPGMVAGLVTAAEAALRREALDAQASPAAVIEDAGAAAEGAPEAPAGSSQALELALAGSSFALAVAGVLLPGIPSAPFLMLTAHHLIRSSPTVHHWLLRIPRVGDLIRKLEASGGLKLDRRLLLKAIGLGLLAAAAFLIIHPPLPLVIALELGLMAFFGLNELEELADGELGLEVLTKAL